MTYKLAVTKIAENYGLWEQPINDVQMRRGQRSKTTPASAADDDDDDDVWQTLVQLEEVVTDDQPWISKFYQVWLTDASAYRPPSAPYYVPDN